MAITVGTLAESGNTSASTTIASAAVALASGKALNRVAVFINDGSSTVTGVVDTAGNMYYRAGGSGKWDEWYAYNCVGNASNVVTATYSSAQSYRALSVTPVDGVDVSADPLIDYKSASGNSATPATATLTAPSGSLIFGSANSDSDGNTAANGFTVSSWNASGDGTAYFADAYKISSGDAPLSIACSSSPWQASAASYRAAAAFVNEGVFMQELSSGSMTGQLWT